eukprot:703536-Pleurochrysis_carterae.AAC.4
MLEGKAAKEIAVELGGSGPREEEEEGRGRGGRRAKRDKSHKREAYGMLSTIRPQVKPPAELRIGIAIKQVGERLWKRLKVRRTMAELKSHSGHIWRSLSKLLSNSSLRDAQSWRNLG